ncbi:hypothetical protein ACLOJK_005112 [Asimina triloba]
MHERLELRGLSKVGMVPGLEVKLLSRRVNGAIVGELAKGAEDSSCRHHAPFGRGFYHYNEGSSQPAVGGGVPPVQGVIISMVGVPITAVVGRGATRLGKEYIGAILEGVGSSNRTYEGDPQMGMAVKGFSVEGQQAVSVEVLVQPQRLD